MMLDETTRAEVARLMEERENLDNRIRELTTTVLPETVEVAFYGYRGVTRETKDTRNKLPVELGITPARMVLLGIRQDEVVLQIRPWEAPEKMLLTDWTAWTIRDGKRGLRIGGNKLRMGVARGDQVAFERAWEDDT